MCVVKPSVAILGFVLGSAACITFGLFGVTVVFLVLRSDYPRFAAELPALWASLGAFACLTALAGASFYGSLHGTVWRRGAVTVLLMALATVGWLYWPR